MNKLHPAYLWIGTQDILKNQALNLLKKIYCSSGGCNKCVDCFSLNQKKHFSVRFLHPENQYTTAQLEVIFKTIRFALNKNENFFFVLERADLLTTVCANSLLKSLEEPPEGYHFILLSPKKEGILPTIASRCIIEYFQESNFEYHSLFKFFLDELDLNQNEFAEEISQNKFSETETAILIDQLYEHWLKKYQSALETTDKSILEKSEKVISILNEARENLPMPGSSKIFLKNLFLQFMQLK